jgi:hypothetical protein
LTRLLFFEAYSTNSRAVPAEAVSAKPESLLGNCVQHILADSKFLSGCRSLIADRSSDMSDQFRKGFDDLNFENNLTGMSSVETLANRCHMRHPQQLGKYHKLLRAIANQTIRDKGKVDGLRWFI